MFVRVWGGIPPLPPCRGRGSRGGSREVVCGLMVLAAAETVLAAAKTVFATAKTVLAVAKTVLGYCFDTKSQR